MSHAASALLRIVTYNIHRSIGMDRRTRPDRIAAVLRDVGADVVAAFHAQRERPVVATHDAGDRRVEAEVDALAE